METESIRSAPVVELLGASKSFEGLAVLDGIDFSIGAGQVVAIIGPSGAGKTTLLRCISALHKIDRGTVSICGSATITPSSGEDELARFRQSVGYVFQDFHLWPHKTVLENLCLAPVAVKKVPREAAVARAMELLKKFGLAHKAGEYPDALSGGQMQRVAIARALAMEPKIVLMDEITSALDPELVGSVSRMVRALAADGVAVIVVTHNLEFASEVADRMVFMDKGKIIESGKPAELLANPTSERLREFIQPYFSGKAGKEAVPLRISSV
jgi:polar amino acid transport system ATP-binding protein